MVTQVLRTIKELDDHLPAQLKKTERSREMVLLDRGATIDEVAHRQQ